MRKKIAIAALLLSCCSTAGSADFTYAPLKAYYFFSGPDLDKPAAQQHVDRVVFYIEGEAAREMYERMTVPAIPDCSPHSRVKQAGNLTCRSVQSDEDFVCAVAIGLADGQSLPSVRC
jgi:hypothetical protein